MKWTLISLVVGGALIYALIFAIQAQHEADDSTASNRAALSGNVAQAQTSTEYPTVAQADIPESLPTGLDEDLQSQADSQLVTVEAEPREWEDGAWAAGCRAYEAGDYETACLALEDAVMENETIAYRHYLLGLSYLKSDQPDDAVHELERSAKLAPGHLKSLVNLGRAYLALDEPETAREVVDEALENDLNYADAWHVLGRIELELSMLDEADTAFRKAVASDPDHAFAWNNLGYVRILDGRFDEAIEPLRSATSLRDDIAYFFNNLGVALERTDDPVSAMVAYGRAEELGHAVAPTSRERVEAIVIARGLNAPAGLTDESTEADPLAESVVAEAW